MRNIFVFFDLGGTLVDLRGIVASMAARLSAIRVRGPVPLALLWAVRTAEALPAAQGPRFRSEREIASDVLFNLLAKRGRADARDASIRLVREAWAGYVGTCTLQPDVTVEWLRTIQSKVAGLGVVTDGDTEAVAGVLSHTGLNKLFDSVTTSEAVRSYKPDSGIYRAALKALKAKPAESLFVSDAALDLEGAANLGIGAAWIRRSLLPDLAKPPPGTLVLSRIEDVGRIVTGYAKEGRFELR
jgi:2-haloalkanoic acid dehalogenase type II